jgi:hypothetical protein
MGGAWSCVWSAGGAIGSGCGMFAFGGGIGGVGGVTGDSGVAMTGAGTAVLVTSQLCIERLIWNSSSTFMSSINWRVMS